MRKKQDLRFGVILAFALGTKKLVLFEEIINLWQQNRKLVSIRALIFQDHLKSLVKEMEVEPNMQRLLAMGLVKSIEGRVRDDSRSGRMDSNN
jgi:hypothetical protein